MAEIEDVLSFRVLLVNEIDEMLGVAARLLVILYKQIDISAREPELIDKDRVLDCNVSF